MGANRGMCAENVLNKLDELLTIAGDEAARTLMPWGVGIETSVSRDPRMDEFRLFWPVFTPVSHIFLGPQGPISWSNETEVSKIDQAPTGDDVYSH